MTSPSISSANESSSDLVNGTTAGGTPLVGRGGAFSAAIGQRIAQGLIDPAVPEDNRPYPPQHPIQSTAFLVPFVDNKPPPPYWLHKSQFVKDFDDPAFRFGATASAPTTPTATRSRNKTRSATVRRVNSEALSQSLECAPDSSPARHRQVYDRITLYNIGERLSQLRSLSGQTTPTKLPQSGSNPSVQSTPTHLRTSSEGRLDKLLHPKDNSHPCTVSVGGHSRSYSQQIYSRSQQSRTDLTDYFGNLVSPPAAAYPPLVQTLRSPDYSRSSSFHKAAASTTSRSSDDMAATLNRMYSPSASNSHRAENRPPMSNVLCRNGPQCRKFQEGTCSFNHDFSVNSTNGVNPAKKGLNVESPAFTPTFTPKGTHAQPAKVGISPKAAQAAAFTPRGSEEGAVTPAGRSHSKESSQDLVSQPFHPQQFNEFVPGQSFVPSQQMDSQTSLQTSMNAFQDPFLTQSGVANLDGTQSQLNPYAQQSGIGGQPFFQESSGFKHPLNYHLYATIGPRRENLMAYQRSSTDFFIPDSLREDLQRKSEATLQTFANSTLPQSVEYFHSLVALDTNSQRSSTTFGYPSWIYKATSSRDGHTYALRRIEGFRLTNEAAIRTIQQWKRICSASLVQVYDAFTGRWFNDSSLVIVTDYHPMSQTLNEKHFAPSRQTGGKLAGQIVPENDLWGYIVQLVNVIKPIHDAGLAAQTIMPSKVMQTSKNRLRLNGCGVLDIVQYEQRKSVQDLQRADLEALGRLVLCIAARNQTAHHNVSKALDLISRSYTERLRNCLAWLLTPPPAQQQAQQLLDSTTQPAPSVPPTTSPDTITTLLSTLTDKLLTTFDATLHTTDTLTSALTSELENARLVRLLAKLNVILERPVADHTAPAPAPSVSALYAETGERHFLRLFRDYVFHQVDAEGRPVVDLGHILACLNKLDAGVEERVYLVSRDEQSVFLVSYREVKRGLEVAWGEICRGGAVGSRR